MFVKSVYTSTDCTYPMAKCKIVGDFNRLDGSVRFPVVVVVAVFCGHSCRLNWQFEETKISGQDCNRDHIVHSNFDH